MGVSWVFEFNGQAIEAERMIEVCGGDPKGTFTVDCLPYIPSGGQLGINTNYVLHHSFFPQTTFSIAPIADTPYKNFPKAVADRGFDLILTKMSAGLTPDSGGKFELRGHEYQFRDFMVRVGTATQVTTVKGVIVEVEYEPSFVASQAIAMLQDFMNQFFQPYAGKRPECINKSAPEQYTALDTIYQYLCIFQEMRKKA